jgi:hypothetical protein
MFPHEKNLGIILFVLIICASAFAAPAANSDKAANASQKKPVSLPPTLVFNRKLASTSFVFGEADVSVAGGLVPVAVDTPLSFTCPAGGCTITTEIHLQVGGASSATNRWAVCSELDGNIIPPGACPFVGEIPADGTLRLDPFRLPRTE